MKEKYEHSMVPDKCPLCYKRIRNKRCGPCGADFSTPRLCKEKRIKNKKPALPTINEAIAAPHVYRQRINPYGRQKY